MEQSLCFSPGATIVEIGTGQGGSAFIFGTQAAPRGVRIFTYDHDPAPEVYTHLRGLDVTIRAMSSTQGAESWSDGLIDVLFVDGGHAFREVYADFQHWSAFLRPGARVMFHDFDPPERGGVPHLGVRLFCETLLRRGSLVETRRVGRLLWGTVPEPAAACPPLEAFVETWQGWGDSLRRILRASRPRLAGDLEDPRARFLSHLLGAIPSKDPGDADVLLVFERPFSAASIKRRTGQTGGPIVALVDDWTLGYLIQAASRRNRSLLLALTQSRDVLFKYLELNDMLELARPGTGEIDAIFAYAARTVEDLCGRCAHELVRLHFMDQIAKAMVPVGTG